MNDVDVIYEDNHLLVLNKPAGLATMGADGAPTLHEAACRYLGRKYNKPGRVFLGVVHRLDAMSSGVLLMARTSKAASRLSDQFRRVDDGPQKVYLAVVTGSLPEPHGRWRDWLAKNEAAHRMESVSAATAGAAQAELQYRVLRTVTTGGSIQSLVAVRLLTGRKHQIRVQFAARGHQVLGDVKYGAKRQSFTGIALHAWSLTVQHPTRGEPLTFQCLPPVSWGRWRPTPDELQTLQQPSAW
ncbi:MAG: RluA family pseudouridine synthase [Planctomycetaceae bacterium]